MLIISLSAGHAYVHMSRNSPRLSTKFYDTISRFHPSAPLPIARRRTYVYMHSFVYPCFVNRGNYHSEYGCSRTCAGPSISVSSPLRFDHPSAFTSWRLWSSLGIGQCQNRRPNHMTWHITWQYSVCGSACHLMHWSATVSVSPRIN